MFVFFFLHQFTFLAGKMPTLFFRNYNTDDFLKKYLNVMINMYIKHGGNVFLRLIDS